MANVTCQNCGWSGDEDSCENVPLRGLLERVAPGEIMPVGECCDCGSLCHYDVNPEGVAGFTAAEWEMLWQGVELLQPDSDEGEAMRGRIMAEIWPMTAVGRRLAEAQA